MPLHTSFWQRLSFLDEVSIPQCNSLFTRAWPLQQSVAYHSFTWGNRYVALTKCVSSDTQVRAFVKGKWNSTDMNPIIKVMPSWNSRYTRVGYSPYLFTIYSCRISQSNICILIKQEQCWLLPKSDETGINSSKIRLIVHPPNQLN